MAINTDYKTIDRLRLVKEKCDIKRTLIRKSEDIYLYVKGFYQDDIEIYESMFMIMTNRNNSIIGYVKISQGGISGTVTDIRIISKYAIESLCSGVILCHNHPSGNKNPSASDEAITKRIKESLNLFDIQLLDHIIITSSDNYYSFADAGLI